MYRVFIIDDEPLVVKSLEKSINWNELGFEVIGKSYNGIDAYEQILRLRPELVFVDIRMPGMTGLELIKKLRDLAVNVQFIIISGYAEFAYAQKAISYGVLGFCLKPFEDDEIINTLKKAKNVLDKSKTLFETEILALIEERAGETEKEAEKSFEAFGLKLDINKGILIMVSFGHDELTFPAGIEYFTLRLGANKYAYLISSGIKTDMEHIKNDLMTSIRNDIKLNEEIIGVGIGKVVFSLEDLKEAIEDSSIGAYQFFMTGQKDVYKIEDINNVNVSNLIKGLKEALISRNLNLMQLMLDKIKDAFKKGIYNIIHAFTVYNNIISCFYEIGLDSDLTYIYSFEQLLELFDTAEDMLEYFKELLIKNLNEDPEYISKSVKNENLKAILQYVNENFASDISLQDISREFTINPSYASQLFKKEMDMTFTEYLTKMRISYACQLLNKTNLTISNIAEKSGYNDYFYFIRSFKKVVGITPSQYRESMMKG